MNALRAAERSTGIISNEMANKETVKSKINATTVYPRRPDKVKQKADINIIIPAAKAACFPMLNLLKRNLFMNNTSKFTCRKRSVRPWR